MTVFDRVKLLADRQKISIVELEERLNFGKNSLYSWKKKMPNSANLEKVADYFGVSTDYLLGRNDTPEWANQKDTMDLEDFLNGNLKVNMAYGGEDLTDEEIERLKIAMTQIFWDKRKQEK